MDQDRIKRYASTILEFQVNPEFAIDLRKAVSQRDRELLKSIGLQGQFAVITAMNPDGSIAPTSANVERLSLLAWDLGAKSETVIQVLGRSPDGSHVEKSFAVSFPFEEACQLGRLYRQDAIFYFDGDAFSLAACFENQLRIELPQRQRP